ncbi:hypothetical protein EDD57_105107 [Baia soyae]|uniref:Uncharacterized protein n=2 Tax=Baia soyae TaxID=1544746 RepID=A0A4V6NRU2_9BACL|nr:hypothetical protein EDD57_105107 [Baia soyae]
MTALTNIFADLHIHIGRTQTNRPVKITAAQNLTFRNILQEASDRKGLQCIGIIDAQSPSVLGVADRIAQLADQPTKHLNHRPPYIHQIPLEFLPGVGKKTIDRLLSVFGTEMNILHSAKLKDLQSIVGDRIAHYIDLSRKGMVDLVEGGGGSYGKIKQ